MTAAEVNSLVSNALRKARKATTPVKARAVIVEGNMVRNGFGGGSPTMQLNTSRSSFDEQLEEAHGLFRDETGRLIVKGSPPSSPTRSIMSAMTTPSVTKSVVSPPLSMNSGDDVLRRVEEEIALARKAAEDANRRLQALASPPSAEKARHFMDIDDALLHTEEFHDILSVSSSGSKGGAYHDAIEFSVPGGDKAALDAVKIAYAPQPEKKSKVKSSQSEKKTNVKKRPKAPEGKPVQQKAATVAVNERSVTKEKAAVKQSGFVAPTKPAEQKSKSKDVGNISRTGSSIVDDTDLMLSPIAIAMSVSDPISFVDEVDLMVSSSLQQDSTTEDMDESPAADTIIAENEKISTQDTGIEVCSGAPRISDNAEKSPSSRFQFYAREEEEEKSPPNRFQFYDSSQVDSTESKPRKLNYYDAKANDESPAQPQTQNRQIEAAEKATGANNLNENETKDSTAGCQSVPSEKDKTTESDTRKARARRLDFHDASQFDEDTVADESDAQAPLESRDKVLEPDNEGAGTCVVEDGLKGDRGNNPETDTTTDKIAIEEKNDLPEITTGAVEVALDLNPNVSDNVVGNVEEEEEEKLEKKSDSGEQNVEAPVRTTSDEVSLESKPTATESKPFAQIFEEEIGLGPPGVNPSDSNANISPLASEDGAEGGDEGSEYTEETVEGSQAEEIGDDGSEYTEETVDTDIDLGEVLKSTDSADEILPTISPSIISAMSGESGDKLTSDEHKLLQEELETTPSKLRCESEESDEMLLKKESILLSPRTNQSEEDNIEVIKSRSPLSENSVQELASLEGTDSKVKHFIHASATNQSTTSDVTDQDYSPSIPAAPTSESIPESIDAAQSLSAEDGDSKAEFAPCTGESEGVSKEDKSTPELSAQGDAEKKLVINAIVTDQSLKSAATEHDYVPIIAPDQSIRSELTEHSYEAILKKAPIELPEKLDKNLLSKAIEEEKRLKPVVGNDDIVNNDDVKSVEAGPTPDTNINETISVEQSRDIANEKDLKESISDASMPTDVAFENLSKILGENEQAVVANSDTSRKIDIKNEQNAGVVELRSTDDEHIRPPATIAASISSNSEYTEETVEANGEDAANMASDGSQSEFTEETIDDDEPIELTNSNVSENYGASSVNDKYVTESEIAEETHVEEQGLDASGQEHDIGDDRGDVLRASSSDYTEETVDEEKEPTWQSAVEEEAYQKLLVNCGNNNPASPNYALAIDTRTTPSIVSPPVGFTTPSIVSPPIGFGSPNTEGSSSAWDVEPDLESVQSDPESEQNVKLTHKTEPEIDTVFDIQDAEDLEKTTNIEVDAPSQFETSKIDTVFGIQDAETLEKTTNATANAPSQSETPKKTADVEVDAPSQSETWQKTMEVALDAPSQSKAWKKTMAVAIDAPSQSEENKVESMKSEESKTESDDVPFDVSLADGETPRNSNVGVSCISRGAMATTDPRTASKETSGVKDYAIQDDAYESDDDQEDTDKENIPKMDPLSDTIEFSHPYPRPNPLPKPRQALDIIKDTALGIPAPFSAWSTPKAELHRLLIAAQQVDSLPRSSNACGALKVLSQKMMNRMSLVRARGFLDSMVFAISQDIPEFREREMALDARTRAVSTILNVSEIKENRTIVTLHPGLLGNLVRVIREDQGEARVQACTVIAVLAKTPANREPLAAEDGLLDALALVLRGTIDDERGRPTIDDEEEEGKKEEDEDEGIHQTDSPDEEDDEVSEADDTSFSTMDDGSAYQSLHTNRTRSNLSSGVNSSKSNMSSGIHPTESNLSSRKQKSKKKKKVIPNSIRRQKNKQYDAFLKRARVNSCAAMIHLSKHCAISVCPHSCFCSICKRAPSVSPMFFPTFVPKQRTLVQNTTVITSLIKVSREFDNPIHTKCVEMICNLTRFPQNNPFLARNNSLLDTLVKCGKSKTLQDRVWSLRAFQNISADASSKVILANSRILTLLSICSMRKDYDEQIAAVAALYNLSTEPGAVVPLTNTKNVVATLVHLAHNAVSTPEIRLMACDALATIGLWLQTLAGSGKVPEGVIKVLLPSHTTTGWERWE